MTEATIDNNTQKRFDEFSPRRLILMVHKAFSYLFSKWFIILFVGVLLGGAYAAYSFYKKPKYTAEFTFALDDGAANSSAGNSLSALSQQLGFESTYEAGGVFSSMTNILELMQSRLIIEKTLKRSVTPYNKQIVFADFFLDSLGYRKKWMKGSPYYNIDFLKTNAPRAEEFFRNGIINNIYTVINAALIKIDKKGKGTTLISITLTSENELFSKYFLEALVDEVSKFYVEIKTQRSKLQLNLIKRRTDSIRGAFGGALYGKAAFTDANINPVRQVAVVPGERKQTDVQVLRETYIDLVKSLESAKTSLMQETPLFQYLDTPVLPLKSTADNLVLKFFIFFVIGIILTSFFLLARKFYRFLLQNG
jgi:cbb3-type cytochrome oxidase subunit 3